MSTSKFEHFSGFVLTKQQFKTQNGFALCYWLATDHGPVRAIVDQQEAVFFILASDLEWATNALADQHIQVRSSVLPLKTFQQQIVAALYFRSLTDFYNAKKYLSAHHIRILEGDIRHSERYLMERFIRGSAQVAGNLKRGQSFSTLSSTKMKSCNYLPTLKMLSLDIECSGKGILYSVGLFSQGISSVIMVGESQDTTQDIQWVNDETQLLLALELAINEYDPDVIIGWNIIDFDFTLLVRRAEQLGIELKLGRAAQKVQLKDSKVGKLLVPGRVVLDGIDTLKNATYQFSSFSLANVAHQLLGESKLIDSDDRLAEIEWQFKHDKLSLAAYNLKDCQLVWDIFEQEKLLDFALLRTQLTGLDIERQGGSVAAFVNLYLPLMHRSGYVAPNLGDHDVHFSSPGGYVMNSEPGLYKNVIVLDFKSLYPSIIRTFLIDPIGLIEGLADPENAVAGYHEAFFSRTEHHLPKLIDHLWQARDEAKAAKDKMRSQAIKIIMNSFYGVLGSTGCRFYDPRLASSITLRGHDIMLKTRAEIERLGFKVIYGDTDSTFVALNDEFDTQLCQQTGRDLERHVNDFWQNYCENNDGLTSYLELEFETIYSPFFMPTIRGSVTGSKKRYVGQVEGESGSLLVFKGMETVRSDWTELARQFQQELFERIFAGESVEVYIKQTISDLMAGKLNHLLVYRKRLGQNLSEYVKNIPPHAQAALKFQLDNPDKHFQRGQWIEYMLSQSGPIMVSGGPVIPDLEHYLEKQLRPIAESILPTINLTFERFLSGQEEMF